MNPVSEEEIKFFKEHDDYLAASASFEHPNRESSSNSSQIILLDSPSLSPPSPQQQTSSSSSSDKLPPFEFNEDQENTFYRKQLLEEENNCEFLDEVENRDKEFKYWIDYSCTDPIDKSKLANFVEQIYHLSKDPYHTPFFEEMFRRANKLKKNSHWRRVINIYFKKTRQHKNLNHFMIKKFLNHRKNQEFENNKFKFTPY